MYKKEEVLIMNQKVIVNNDKTREYLLYIPKRQYQPFIVCTDFTIEENGNVNWNYGHYCNTIFQALIVQYERELKNPAILEGIEKIRHFYPDFNFDDLSRLFSEPISTFHNVYELNEEHLKDHTLHELTELENKLYKDIVYTLNIMTFCNKTFNKKNLMF